MHFPNVTTSVEAFHLLDHLPQGVCILQGEWKVVYWNACLEEWTGLSKSDIVGQPLGHFFPHLMELQYTSRLEMLFSGGPPVTFASQFHPQFIPCALPDGHPRIQHTIAKAVPAHEESHQWYAMLVIDDVTPLYRQVRESQRLHQETRKEIDNRKITEGRLRKNEETFRAVVEMAPSGMLMLDQQGTMVLVNHLLMKQFGYAREELLGQPVELLIPEQFRRQHPAHRASFWANPSPRAMGEGRELYGLHKDGSEIPIEIGLNPLATTEGSYVLASVVDITARKATQQELLSLQASLAHTVEGISRLDAHNTYTMVNHAYARMLGYRPEELLGGGWEHTVHPDDLELAKEAYQEMRNDGKGAFEARGIRKDGTTFYKSVTMVKILDQTETFVGYHCFSKDITTKKRQDQLIEAIRQAKSKFIGSGDAQETFKGLLNSALSLSESEFGFIGEVLYGETGAPYLKTHALSNIAWNQETKNLYAKQAPHFEFKNLQTLFGQVLETGKPVMTNDPMNDPRSGGLPSGHPLLHSFLGLPIYHGEQFVGMIGIANRTGGYDEEVEKFLQPFLATCGMLIGAYRMDMQRRESEEKVHLVVEASPSGMIMIDSQGTIVLANQLIDQLFGYEHHELLGQSIEVLIPERFRGEHPAHREQYFASPSPRGMGSGRDLFGQRKDGTEFPVEIGLNPLTVKGKTFVLATVVDITARKREEATLYQYMQDLHRSNQELDEFAYIASHDLKEPLRGIYNYSAILLEEHGPALDEGGRARCETLIKLSRRMEELINSLLEFSRAGRTDLAMSPTDLQPVLEEILDSLAISLDEHRMAVRIPKPLPTVECDRVCVREILLNLITNAMKYSNKDAKWIEIGWMPAEEEGPADGPNPRRGVVFYVRDNGIGIREKHLKNIFRMFKRLHGRDKFGGGTGIGLTITKKLIERHGGELWVESVFGEGSTFFFTLQRSERYAGVE